MAYHHGVFNHLITSMVNLPHSKSSGGSWNQQKESFNEVDSFEQANLQSVDGAKDIRTPMQALVVLGPRPLSKQPREMSTQTLKENRKRDIRNCMECADDDKRDSEEL